MNEINVTPKNQFADIVLWSGKPLIKPYLIKHILNYKGTVQVLLIGTAVTVFGSLFYNLQYNWRLLLIYISILCIAGVIQVLLKTIGYKQTKYWITKEKLYIQTGIIKPSVKTIHKHKILFLDIEESSVEKRYKVGTVLIDCGELKTHDNEEYKFFHRLEAIRDPAEVLRLF